MTLSPFLRSYQTPREPRTGAVHPRAGRPLIHIDGQPCLPMLYALTDVPSGRWSWEELPQHTIGAFGARGIRLFQLDLSLEHVWPSETEFDLTLARRQVAGVLEVCPEASVIFRFHLRPPRWWLESHPDEWVAYADSGYSDEQASGLLRIIEHDNNPVRRVSMASSLWREIATARLERFLRAFAATPEGHALVGIQVANGVYGEWHNWGFFANEPDVSAPMTQAFRHWLEAKYRTVERLREAWNDPQASFASARPPGMAERATEGIFRDPARERPVIDYYECMHEVVVNNILHFARTAKATWPRPLIVGTFYGYFFSCFGRYAAGGHLQLQRLLASPSIDYLSGPQAYEPEAIAVGDVYRSRGLLESIRLHGKLWLDEMDCEPKIPLLKDADYAARLQESVADVRRNTAFSLLKGMGLWFYDFNVSGVDLDGYQHAMLGSQGTWDHPVVMRQIERLRALFTARLIRPYEGAADVLLVYDTDSFYYTASLKGADPVNPVLVDHLSLAVYRSGVIFDAIHLDDLPRAELDRYKVVIFGNTSLMAPGERKFIREEVAREGRHLVWLHAPGYLEESTGKADESWVEELTGFRLKRLELSPAPSVLFTGPDETPVHYALGTAPITPLFAIEDPAAEILGRFVPSGDGAIGRKVHPGHTAWFVSLPGKEPEPIRSILRLSGAHHYGEGDGIFYGGCGLLLLHTLTGKARQVTLRNGTVVSLDLPPGPATILLDAHTGELILDDYESERESVVVSYPR
jgi:hypothetical protein